MEFRIKAQLHKKTKQTKLKIRVVKVIYESFKLSWITLFFSKIKFCLPSGFKNDDFLYNPDKNKKLCDYFSNKVYFCRILIFLIE